MTRATALFVLFAAGVVFAPAPVLADPPAGPAAATDAASTTAQEAPAPPATDFNAGEINIDLLGRNLVESSKFEEYRDVPRGVSLPWLRMFGSEGQVQYDFRAENVRLLDERYTGSLKTNLFAVTADYNAIIHRIGNGGRTMLSEQTPGVWKMSSSLQQYFQNVWESTPTANRVFTTFVAPLFTPSIMEGNIVDVAVERQRTSLSMNMARNQPFTATMTYFREQRHGSGGLSSNYLSYTTETPSVTEYLTQDVGVNAAINKPWGFVRGGLHYNWFDDQVPALLFDSPFRATDALVATVGTGAAATSVGGPTAGRMVNPPSNTAYTTTVAAMFKLAHQTRITADGSFGRWAQNDQFFPYLTNTAVVTPVLASQTSSLPAQSLNGKINTNSFVFLFTSRPVDPLQVTVRYRYYDLNNQTASIAFPGFGSWDRSWSANARQSVPYSNTNGRLDATAAYSMGVFTLEGGYRRATVDRTYRETEQTAENTGSVSAIFKVADSANVRASYERSTRGYTGLDLGRSEDASFVVPPTGLSANVLNRPGNLRFDQANRDSNRAGILLDASPNEMLTVGFAYWHNNDTYNDTAHGMQDMTYDTVTGEFTVTGGERWTVTGYYTHENNGSTQINNGTSNFPVNEDFTINLSDKGDTTGASARFSLVPSRATLNLGAFYQNLKGTAGFVTSPTSGYQLARASMGGVKDIPNADNVKLSRVDASVEYLLRPRLSITVGAWFEDYSFSDVDSAGLQNIYPGAFFLALNDGSYNAKVVYTRLTYRF